MTVFYCHEPGHLIAVCTTILKTNKAKQKKKETGFIKTASPSEPDKNPDTEVDSHFKPFKSKGIVSLTGDGKNKVLATTLTDTVAYH